MLDLTDYGISNFFQILKRRHPELLASLNASPATSDSIVTETSFQHYEGTTVLAVVYDAGVVMAGDRQATEGYQVGERRIQKVYPVDRYSAIAVAGAAGPCIEMAKLFQVEVEFYEKTEGMALSLEGQANFLSHLVRSNLGLAMQGLIVLPLFAGYDLKQQRGRISNMMPSVAVMKKTTITPSAPVVKMLAQRLKNGIVPESPVRTHSKSSQRHFGTLLMKT